MPGVVPTGDGLPAPTAAGIARGSGVEVTCSANGGMPQQDYAITVDSGSFKAVPVAPEDLSELQRNLLYSHLAGPGEAPDDGTSWIVALLDLLADVTEIGATAIADLGRAAGVFLRTVSASRDATYVEFSDWPGQGVWRSGAAGSPPGYWLLARAASPPADTPVAWNGMSGSAGRPGRPHPTVFVSYAQESPRHKADVLRFCAVLAASGVEPRLDCGYLEERRDWQLWATQQITEADYVIVIASESCRLVGDGKNDPGVNLGLQSEMRLLRELYHADNEMWTKRILPVVLPGRRIDDIPLFLQPRTADHFVLPEITATAAEGLLRILHREPASQRPSVEPAPDRSAS